MNEHAKFCFSSPLGLLFVSVTDGFIEKLSYSDSIEVNEQEAATDLQRKIRIALDKYFAGDTMHFDLPLRPEGTSFEKTVWKAVQKIPYGATASYLDIAREIGKEDAVRAVGRANGKNPIPILIPCHRIIGSNQKLTGYSGGIERKEWLLKHEGSLLI